MGSDIMNQNIELAISFESLADCIKKLDIDDKIRLWELLEEQLERDLTVQSEISEARTAYEKGDYITIDEYIKKRKDRNGL